MSKRKKAIRRHFRESVWERDGHQCAICGESGVTLDAHHITDRNEMPNGGYVKENGISLCEPCHWKAEAFHRTGTPEPGYEPETLYQKVGSSYEEALRKSERL